MKTLRNVRNRFVMALLATAIAATSAPAQQKQQPSKARVTKTKAMPASEPIVLHGGKLLTVTKGTIENGVLVMENGKITAVGAEGSVAIPKNAKVVDVKGMTVYPGLIDSETHLGLTEIDAERMSNDLVEESDEIMPHMHVYDAFHAESTLIPVTRLNGVTNAIVAPTSQDTLPGQDSFIQLYGHDADEMLMVRDIAMPMNFTGDQRRNESFDKAKYPFTRMGMAAQLRQAFLDAQQYQRQWDEYNKKASSGDKKDQSATPPKKDLKLEALLPYLSGQKTVVLQAEEPSDIRTSVELANEFKLRYVLDHISYAEPVLDQVAALKVPVIIGTIYTIPHDEQRYDAVYRLPGELVKRGVKVAFATNDAHNSRNLPYEAGYAVAFGMPYEEALKAITINPAEIWGVADKLGSLEVGKMANVVVATGDPLDVKTDVKQVYIEGVAVPMESRQTRLRDQYMK